MDWTQLMQAGALQDQTGQLDQQLADVLLRRRNYQPTAPQHTTGLGALLAGIGDYRNKQAFNDQETGLRQQRSDLMGRMAQGRQSYLQEMMQAQQGGGQTPAAEGPGGMPSFGAQPDPQRQQQLTMAGMLSGDPMIQNYLQKAPQMAQEQQTLEQGAQRFPLQQAMERQKMQQEGPQAALGGLPPSIYEKLTKRQEVAKYAVNPVSGRIYDVRTGEEVAGSGGPGGAPTDKRLPKMQEAFAKDFDPSISRGGLQKENQARSNAADRIMALAVGKDPLSGQEMMNNLTPQQMTELATSAAALLSSGGGDAGTRHEMTPYTKGRTWAQVVQWLTDAPHGADQQAFVKQIVDMSRREQGVAQNQIRSTQQSRLTNHLGYYSLFPDQARAQMQGYGWDPSEVDFKTGKYTAKQKQAAAPAGGPAKVSSDAEWEALPSGAQYTAPDGTTRTKR